MARDDTGGKAPPNLLDAQISLMGEVTEGMAASLVEQLRGIEDGEQAIVIEMTTLGGDAEFARASGWRRAGWRSSARRSSTRRG